MVASSSYEGICERIICVRGYSKIKHNGIQFNTMVYSSTLSRKAYVCELLQQLCLLCIQTLAQDRLRVVLVFKGLL